jgi:hypothetical protein
MNALDLDPQSGIDPEFASQVVSGGVAPSLR